MRFIKKYFFLLLMAIVITVSVPFVIKSAIDKNARTEGDAAEEPWTEEPWTEEPHTQEPHITEPALPQDTASALPSDSSTPGSDLTPAPTPSRAPADASYFDDALFIGDSRTSGLESYGTLKNADYFCFVGMSVYNIRQREANVKGLGKMTFDNFITRKQYKKIYIMLGFNEIGYPKKKTVTRYKELIDSIRALQPDAIFYVQANLLVTEQCSKTDKYSHNPDILELNSMLSELADNKEIFYIDINELFGDGKGNLRNELTGDGTHVYAKYYRDWCDWLISKAV